MFERCMQVMELMSDYPGKWMIAGGWALDLHIGEKTREHRNIKVAVFRDDQKYLSSLLDGWEVHVMREQELVMWDMLQPLEPPVYEIHASRQEGMNLEVLLNERREGRWRLPGNPRLSFSLAHMNLQSEQGIPYLNPEITLLYKAKDTEEKDHQDFNYIFPYLNEHQKEWLKQSLIQYQPNHPWLESLLHQ